ncbi:MAG: DUF885 domain-containing protein [Armatimonadota bacterium]
MSANVEFEQLAHGFLADYLEFYPTLGTRLGLHVYDGRPGEYSTLAIDAWIRTLGMWNRRLGIIDTRTLARQEAHDAALIAQAIGYERFQWDTLRDYQRNPIAGSWIVDVTPYLKRNYAPLAERLLALTSHVEQIPRVLEEMRGHLRAELPRPIVETAKEVYEGYLSFYKTSLREAAGGTGDGALRARFQAALDEAVEALTAHLRFLAEAHDRATDEVAIGEANFTGLLRTGELVELPLERLIVLGEAELARLAGDVRETAARIDPRADPRDVMTRLGDQHPAAEALIPETAAMLEGLRRFLVEREIVTLPSDVRPIVAETPPFDRWAFAMMDTAGPLETAATESYYYVTLPEPDWPPERREQWLSKFDYATLKATSIHEAYPGHFVHFLHVRGAPTLVSKALTSYSFVEGWAHYCEEMMLEAGVDSDPKFRLAYLAEALVRQVRYLAAIRMHTGDLSVAEAQQMFERHAFMEAATAQKEAVRGTFDPGYLNYTLGKFMMRRLRDDYRAQRGSAYSLCEFHDRLLALGAPPMPLARKALLERDSGVIL